jgi:hypothetical protein
MLDATQRDHSRGAILLFLKDITPKEIQRWGGLEEVEGV